MEIRSVDRVRRRDAARREAVENNSSLWTELIGVTIEVLPAIGAKTAIGEALDSVAGDGVDEETRYLTFLMGRLGKGDGVVNLRFGMRVLLGE